MRGGLALVGLASLLLGCEVVPPPACGLDPGPTVELPPATLDRPSVAIGGSTTNCTGQVTLTWQNLTTGASGTAGGSGSWHDETVCLPFVCWVVRVCEGTRYGAEVPLALGTNVLDYTVVEGCSASRRRWTVTRAPDTVPPAVVAASLDDAPGTATASVSFSEEVDCATAGAVTLSREGSGPVEIRRACHGQSIDLSGFATVPLGRYTLAVSPALTDLAGNPLGAPFARTVLTRALGPPAVVSVSPPDRAAGVPLDAVVQATFDLPVDPATASGLRLLAGSTPVPGSATADGAVVTFRPDRPLDGQTDHTAEVTTALAGIDGQHLAAGTSWTFRTADVLPPQVTGFSPADGTPNVDPDVLVGVRFTEDVRVAPGGFTLTGPGGVAVDGSIELQPGQLRFRPAGPLSPGATFTATVGAGVTDLAGNALAAPTTWSFTVIGSGVGRWRAMSAAGAPSPRRDFAWAWTGTELLVWGGTAVPGGTYLGDGARYDPLTDTWRPISPAGAPSARARPVTAWTGAELLVWGGDGLDPGAFSGTGGRYDPATDSWRPIATSGTHGGFAWQAPTPRTGSAVAWTGSELVVLGGLGCYGPQGCPWGSILPDGGQYVAAEDRWRPVGGAVQTSFPAFAWTGDRLLVFGPGGGRLGLSWDPVALAGVPLAADGRPPAPDAAGGVFTGDEFLVWGGGGDLSPAAHAGYRPATGRWRSLSTENQPPPGAPPGPVWTGSRMLVWGGGTRTGGLYDPVADAWETTALEGAPSARSGHAAAWTGTELLVWGGDAAGTGARYLPPP
jgi:hypothetical protein